MAASDEMVDRAWPVYASLVFKGSHVDRLRAILAAALLDKEVQGVTAITEAHDMLLDMYRTWIADDSEAYPKPDTPLGQLLARLSLPVSNTGEWKPMETAPKDGKHCILAVNEGAFVWSVQGAFQDGQWNAVHRNNVEPLCWMPNVRVPKEFLPWEKSE